MKRINYRHYISIAITLGFIAYWLLFPNALGRLIESVRDFGLSCAYYVCELFGNAGAISPTVNNLPKNTSDISFPFTWSEFKIKWALYWQLWADKNNFFSYLSALGNILYYVSYFLLIALPFVLLFVLLFRRYLKTQNNDYDKESKALKIFKQLSDFTYRPIKNFILNFIAFLKGTPVYMTLWACLWAFYFNVFTIVIEFFAYYLYFVVSFDAFNLYRQIYKLFLDLSTVISFFPLWAWLIIGLAVFECICRKIGYAELNHRERRNCGFINERGVVTTVYGVMGAGKTKLITDMALSKQKLLRDQAFQIILEADFKFPCFPWINLEQDLKKAIAFHVCFSVPSVKQWLKKKYSRWRKAPCKQRLFDYDYVRYGSIYNDGLKSSDIWEILEDYACAYFIYTVQSSLLIANYSIRSDELLSDLGNFPLWNEDFFKRDSKLLDSYSRHAHILDFDMLRLGKRLLKDNPNRFAFGFGVYVISEVDKERKNNLELQSERKRASDEEPNQKNDLFNTLLKMSRHACVIANRIFLMILCDLQRPEDWGAGGREVGEVVYIADKGEMSPALPFFSPFYFFEIFFSFLFGKFTDTYVQYRYVRADNTLPMYIMKNTVAFLRHYAERTENIFNSSTMKLYVESGRMDGDGKECKYYIQSKKIYAKRYSTDCLSGIFERYAIKNTVSIEDLPEYEKIMASDSELLRQNSFFQADVHEIKE